jgi:hypothetical protein
VVASIDSLNIAVIIELVGMLPLLGMLVQTIVGAVRSGAAPVWKVEEKVTGLPT